MPRSGSIWFTTARRFSVLSLRVLPVFTREMSWVVCPGSSPTDLTQAFSSTRSALVSCRSATSAAMLLIRVFRVWDIDFIYI